MIVKLNGESYAVGVASVERSIRRLEKYNVTTEDGRVHREVRATYMDFKLSLGNFGIAEYDRLMSFLRSATGDIAVELPSSAASSEIYVGAFDSVSDQIVAVDDTCVLWDNLTLTFVGTEPIEVGL